jgi:hypothetical protein
MLVTAALAVAVIARCGGSSAPRADVSPSDLLNRTSKTYATAEVYRDRGTVTLQEPLGWSLVQSLSGRRTNEFRTTFRRHPSSATFMFHGRAGARFGLAVSPSSSVALIGFDVPEARPATIADAARALRPVTAGASDAVVPLLVGGNGIASMHAESLLEDEDVHGEPCFRVRGVTAGGTAQTLSIEKRRFVIRRIRQELKLRGGDTTTRTIDYAEVRLVPKA